jgi:hypothetical protein
MRISCLIVLAASAFVVTPIAHSQIFYDSLSSATGSQGFVNSPIYFGDALTLSGTSAEINSLAFRVDGISPSTATGSFQAFFYNINAGTDGVYQTGDETFGSLIGSSSSQSFSVSNGSTITLSGFSVTVPKNFLWIVYNPNLSLLISDLNSSAYSSVTGGSSAVTSGYWSSTAPANGGSLKMLSFTGTHPYASDFAVQLSGSMVPEPSAGSLLVLGAGVLAVIRRRKKD